MPNPYVVIGGIVGWLASIALTGWLMYARGHDDMRNAYTEQQLASANQRLADAGKNNKIADDAGKKFEDAKPRIITQIQYRTREIVIPPDADPFMPVWFVRMWDRVASGSSAADPYPGLDAGAASDVRLSEVRTVLERWAGKYETCQLQIDSIRQLKPVLPPPPATEKPSVFEQLNPF